MVLADTISKRKLSRSVIACLGLMVNMRAHGRRSHLLLISFFHFAQVNRPLHKLSRQLLSVVDLHDAVKFEKLNILSSSSDASPLVLGFALSSLELLLQQPIQTRIPFPMSLSSTLSLTGSTTQLTTFGVPSGFPFMRWKGIIMSKNWTSSCPRIRVPEANQMLEKRFLVYFFCWITQTQPTL